MVTDSKRKVLFLSSALTPKTNNLLNKFTFF